MLGTRRDAASECGLVAALGRDSRSKELSVSLFRRFLLAAACLLFVLSGALIAPTSPADAIGEATFTNPVLPDGADPTIEFFDGNYYLVATTWDNRVVMRKAPTLEGLKTAAPVTVYSDTTAGRNANMWAPELKRLTGPNGPRWYLMYTMGTAGTFDRQHLQVIESAGDDPTGPYAYKGQPIPTNDWNIDGSYLELNGELFVTWSMFSPEPNRLQSNYIARMSNPWTATGPINILSQPTADWERIGMPVNEGPVPLQKDGKTWIVFSASSCGTEDYQLGTLRYTGGDPVLAASWNKSAGPVFSKANGVFGPGHNDFFTSPDGTQTWNLYHGNARADGGCARQRSARAQQVTWNASGEPDFGTPIATGTPIAVPSGERGPVTASVEGASFEVVNRNSGLCLTVAGGSTVDGGNVVQGACANSATAASSWVMDSTADGAYRFVNASTNKVLDSANCGTADGTDARQWAWLANTCQEWLPAPASEGYLTIANRANGKMLDVANCTTAAGGEVRQWRALGNACQQWSIRPVGPTQILSVPTGKSFDVPNCDTAIGAILQQHQYLGSPCQTYTFSSDVGGAVHIHPASAPALCLTVSGGSTADGAGLVQEACGTASSWRLTPLSDGSVRFVSALTGKSIDLANCATGDGARLQQYSLLDNACQRFTIK
ncbi:alpha-L-arabinofuranosidase [Plantibacter flavus]|nr:RICIN domain-containing protein [Plantibacter sp. CFBP 8775]MBD8467371.1 RICIN domain-containing protein [Plantibacter sp. CFBP 8798]MBD8534563.1 RICIN domain-containing protein [Plantibacter sp. CFBP 13570]TKJ96836.1 alpha-L-arabinofuranosidase [Plantibacter flavus]